MRAVAVALLTALVAAPAAALETVTRVEEPGDGCSSEGSASSSTTWDGVSYRRESASDTRETCDHSTHVATVEATHGGRRVAGGFDAPAGTAGSQNASAEDDGTGCESDSLASCDDTRRRGASRSSWTRDYIGLRTFVEAEDQAVDTRQAECSGNGTSSAAYDRSGPGGAPATSGWSHREYHEQASCTSWVGVGGSRVVFDRCEHGYDLVVDDDHTTGEQTSTFATSKTCYTGLDEDVGGTRLRAGHASSDRETCRDGACEERRTREIVVGDQRFERPYAQGT